MEINSIEVNIDVQYEPTYINTIPQYTRSHRNFFITKEKYEKVLKLLEE